LTAEIHVFDNVMDSFSHEKTWEFLTGPGWSYGAYSDEHPAAPKYWYKHFAGYSASAQEDRDPGLIADELKATCLPLFRMWCAIVAAFVPGQMLGRCYANRMEPGVGGGLHRDSNDPGHLTLIYYPNLTWSPRDAGETLFYDDAAQEVIRAVTPRPNRLVVFGGTIPHVARPLSALAGTDRVTLMFKTIGRAASLASG
jgi:SM-20-related protein